MKISLESTGIATLGVDLTECSPPMEDAIVYAHSTVGRFCVTIGQVYNNTCDANNLIGLLSPHVVC